MAILIRGITGALVSLRAYSLLTSSCLDSPLSLLRLLQSISRGPFHLLFNVVFSNDDDVYHPVIDSCWLYKTQPCPRWTVLIYFASCRDGYLNRHCCIILTDSSIFDFSRFRGNQSTRYQTTEGNGRRQQQWEATDAGHVPGYRTDQPLRPKSYVTRANLYMVPPPLQRGWRPSSIKFGWMNVERFAIESVIIILEPVITS